MSRDDRPAFPDRRPRQIPDMTTPVVVAGDRPSSARRVSTMNDLPDRTTPVVADDRPSPARRLSMMNGRPPYRSSSRPRVQVQDTHASPSARAASAGPTIRPDIITVTSGADERRRGRPRVQVQDTHASPSTRAAAAATGPTIPPDITVTLTSGADERRRGRPRVQVQDTHASSPARAAAAAVGPTTPPDITVTITSGADERRRGLIGSNENEIEEAVPLPSTTTVSNNNTSNTSSSSGLRRFRNPFNRKNGNVSRKKKFLRVYVPSDVDWQPGQIIRVLNPNKCILLATIPPRSKWLYERSITGSNRPYFRMDFDPMAPIGGASCTCVQSLGVTDTACPVHGNMAEEGVIGDDVSIAQEERGDNRVTAPPTPVTPAAATANNNNPGWECKSCVTINHVQNQACSVCHARRPEAFVDPRVCGLREHGVIRDPREVLPPTLDLTPTPVTPAAATTNNNNPGWECKSCVTINRVQNQVCSVCHVRRPEAFVDPRVCGLREHGAIRDPREVLPPTLNLANVTNNGNNDNGDVNSNLDNINAGHNNHGNGNYANEDHIRNDEGIANFLSITFSTDASVARQYLEMSFYNMEAAVSLFMDHGGAKEADIGSAVAASMSNDTENALAASTGVDMERALAASLVGDNIESALASSIGSDIERALAASMGVAVGDQATHVGANGVGGVRVGAMPAAATAGTATRRGQGWECKSCITANAAQSTTCSFCGIQRHGAIRELDIPSATARYEAKLRES